MPNLEQFASSIALVGFRVSGLMLIAPFFGSAAMPVRFKAGLTLLLVWLLAPNMRADAIAASPLAWATVALGELAIGMVLGFSVQLVFEAAQFAGQILGVQLGFSLVHVLDPQSQADTAVLGVLQQTLVLLLFLAMDVPQHMLRGLVRSFSYLPPGSFLLTGMAVSGTLAAAGNLFVAGLQIAAPALAATMLIDLVLGFIGRMSPQLPVLFVGLSIKSVVGLLILSAVLWTWPQYLERAFAAALSQGEQILRVSHRSY